MEPRPSLWVVLREWGRIGCIGFGGPPTHIALLRRLCVDREQWLTAREFEDALAACNLLPGPASTQLAIYCAWRLRGRAGALVGGLAFILPGLILIIALAAICLGSPPRWVRGAGSGAEHPQRRGTGQEQRRQGQDHDQPGHDERGPADQRAGAAAEPPGAEDRQLGGRRAGQQVAGRDRVLELPCVQPLPALDTQFPQQLDVGGRAAEPDAADPAPLPQHRGQGHPRRRGGRVRRRDRLGPAAGVLGHAHRAGVAAIAASRKPIRVSSSAAVAWKAG